LKSQICRSARRNLSAQTASAGSFAPGHGKATV
jgi:hypothetical protein